MDEQEPKTFEQIEVLIWKNPDELSEQEIENFLQVAEVRERLDYENCLAVLHLS